MKITTMKAFVFLLLLPLSLFSQKENTAAAEKPATDACPTWKKKKTSGKAEYFQYLRSAKPRQQQVVTEQSNAFYLPKYRKPAVKPEKTNEQYEGVSAKVPVIPKGPKTLSVEEAGAPVPEEIPQQELTTAENSVLPEAEPAAAHKEEGKKYKRSSSRKKLNLFKGKRKGLFGRKNKAAKCPDF